MKLIHNNKEYSLLLATNKYRYYIYQDELVLVDVYWQITSLDAIKKEK